MQSPAAAGEFYEPPRHGYEAKKRNDNTFERMHYTVVDRLDEMAYQYTYHDSEFMGFMLGHTVWEDDRRIDYINKIIISDQESTESSVWETYAPLQCLTREERGMLKAIFHTHNEKGSGVYYSTWDSHWGAYHQMERPNTFPVGPGHRNRSVDIWVSKDQRQLHGRGVQMWGVNNQDQAV